MGQDSHRSTEPGRWPRRGGPVLNRGPVITTVHLALVADLACKVQVHPCRFAFFGRIGGGSHLREIQPG
jgi:hypothetical protein